MEEKVVVDRRVQRTRQLLQDAIVALIEEKGYEAVTVQDILDRANLGRSTFYAHFRDKEDLLLSGFEKVRSAFEKRHREILAHGGGVADIHWEMSIAWFQHAQSSQRLYKALIGKQAGEVHVKHIHAYLSALLREHMGLPRPAGKGEVTLPEVAVYWTVSSLLALTTWWLDHDFPYTAEQIDAIFKQLTRPGVDALLRRAATRDQPPASGATSL